METKPPSERNKTARRFRVAFSFAGERRTYVQKVAAVLAEKFGEERILFDGYHAHEFARTDLGTYLPKLYSEESDLVVPVLCPRYSTKRWCGWEWMHIYGLTVGETVNRVMPARFELATADGLSPAAGFIDLDRIPPKQFAQLIVKRLALIDRLEGSDSAPASMTVAREQNRKLPLRSTLVVLAAVALIAIFGVAYHLVTEPLGMGNAPAPPSGGEGKSVAGAASITPTPRTTQHVLDQDERADNPTNSDIPPVNPPLIQAKTVDKSSAKPAEQTQQAKSNSSTLTDAPARADSTKKTKDLKQIASNTKRADKSPESSDNADASVQPVATPQASSLDEAVRATPAEVKARYDHVMQLAAILGAAPPPMPVDSGNPDDTGASASLEAAYRAFELHHYQDAYPALQQAADRGVSKAQYLLSMMYVTGSGVPRSFQKAEALLERCADRRTANEIFHLAREFLDAPYLAGSNDDVRMVVETGMKYMLVAAERGSVEAMLRLAGISYEHNDTPSRIRWLEAASAANDPGAMHQLGMLYYNGMGVTSDRDRGLKYILDAVQLKYPAALAWCNAREDCADKIRTLRPQSEPDPLLRPRICSSMDECSMLTGLSQPGGIITPFVADSASGMSIAKLMCRKARGSANVSRASYETGRRRFDCRRILSVLGVSNGVFFEQREPLCRKEIEVITSVDCH